MPRRKSDSCATILLAVAVAFPCTNKALGMYMRRTTPTTEAKIYRSPAILAFLLSEVMRPPDKDVPTDTGWSRESSGSLLRRLRSTGHCTSYLITGPAPECLCNAGVTPEPALTKEPITQGRSRSGSTPVATQS